MRYTHDSRRDILLPLSKDSANRVDSTQNTSELASPAPLELSVASISWKGHVKRLRLEPGSVSLEVPRSACLTKGDKLLYERHKLSVQCDNGTCQVLPIYASSATLSLGGLQLPVLIKEITEPEEHSAYERLADLHYRGQAVHGRTAKLIVRTYDPAYPKVIGFIELATPFFMNKPRSRILDAHFEQDGVGWKKWNIHTLRKNIHRIVRISRTVVSPEFRGFGIGGLLVRHAAEFARVRWQVAGQMPYFLEISADMLKFVPFVRQAGMRYIGDTEGNLSRVERDMSYLIERFGDGNTDTTEFEQISGILDQQIARMKKSLRLMQEHDFTARQLSKKLRRLSARTVLKDFDLFRGIVSLPKPTFLFGLTKYSRKFLDDRLKSVGPTEPSYSAPIQSTPLAGSIRLAGLTITYTTQVRRTLATHAIQQAFDISPTNIRTSAIEGLTCEIAPRSIVLVEGPSGSGKTTLLESILSQDFPNTVKVEGDIDLPEGFRPFAFHPIRSRKSLVELFGDTEIRHALFFLGHAGLSEPFLYLKRFDELSKGQQYRALVAQMLASDSNVWVADEFCSNLDEITANLVADNVQRIARKYGLTLIAATSNPQPFIHSLRPDMVIRLSSASQSSVLTGVEYIRALHITSRRSSPIQHLATEDRSLLFAASGSTTTMIYRGRKQVQRGPLLLSNGDGQELVLVTRRAHRRYGSLCGSDEILDSFENPFDVKAHLSQADPELRDNSFITIIETQRLHGDMSDAG